MMAQLIDRKTMKAETRSLLRTAEVNPRRFTAFYLLLVLLLDQASLLVSNAPIMVMHFVTILTTLMGIVLFIGFTLYCLTIRQGRKAEYLTLFDGFSFVGKIIGLTLVQVFFVYLWAMLFFFPGIIAAYRYRFAYYNLCENPELGIMEALNLSKRQTYGYKSQLFLLDLSYLGWSLLASLPSFLMTFQLIQTTLAGVTDPMTGLNLLNAALNAVPWETLLLMSLFSLVIQLFYLPNYSCVQLGYYDVAKNTSGARPFLDAPDDLGGWS